MYFVTQHIQQDFVRERQQTKVTSDDLIHRMTVAKYASSCVMLASCTNCMALKTGGLIFERARAYHRYMGAG